MGVCSGGSSPSGSLRHALVLPEQLRTSSTARTAFFGPSSIGPSAVTVKGSTRSSSSALAERRGFRIDREKPCFVIENSPRGVGRIAREAVFAPARARPRRGGVGDSLQRLLQRPTRACRFYEAFRSAEKAPRPRLLMVGGTRPGRRSEARVARYGLGERSSLPDSALPRRCRATSRFPTCWSPRDRRDEHPAQDLLVPPRGKAIVATRLLTHPGARRRCAALTEPTPRPSAKRSSRSPETRAAVALARARRLSEERYSYARYLERTREVLRLPSRSASRVPRPGQGSGDRR
jgi:hypothetical protein